MSDSDSDTKTTESIFEDIKYLFSPTKKLVGVDISDTHVRVYQFAEDGKNKFTEVEIGKSNSEEESNSEEKAKALTTALTTALNNADIKDTKIALSVEGLSRYNTNTDYSAMTPGDISKGFSIGKGNLIRTIFKSIGKFKDEELEGYEFDWKVVKKGIFAIAYKADEIKEYEGILKACNLDLELVAINHRKYAIFKGANSIDSNLVFDDPGKTETEYEKLTADRSTKKDNKYLAAIGMARREVNFFGRWAYLKNNKKYTFDQLSDDNTSEQEKIQIFATIFTGFVAVVAVVAVLSGLVLQAITTNKLDVKIVTYEQLVSEKTSEQSKLTQTNAEIEKISGVLNAGGNLDSNQQFMYLVLHSINKAVPRGVSLTNIDYSTKNIVVVSGLSVNDRNILQLIEELSKSESIDKSSLLSMSSKTVDKRMYKSFSIRCVISDQQVTNETEGL